MEAEFLRELRKEMERSYHPHDAARPVVEVVSGESSLLEQAGMQSALAALQGSYALVGQMPPEPPTWRGRVGTKAVRLVRRMLFWYTPQIVRFQYAVLRAFEEQAKALEMANQRVRESQRRQDEARESLESSIRQLERELIDERARNHTLYTELRALLIAQPYHTAEPVEGMEQSSAGEPCQPAADHPGRSAP